MFRQSMKIFAPVFFLWPLLCATADAGSIHIGRPHAGGAPGKWGTPQGHIKFYEKMVQRFQDNPKAFTQRHHLMARALRNPAFKEAMTHRLLTHPARFIRNHPCFSRFLDGERQQLAALNNAPPPPSSGSTSPGGSLGTAGQGLTSGGATSPSQPVSAVPEPSSMILLAAAMLTAGLVRVRKLGRRAIVAAPSRV